MKNKVGYHSTRLRLAICLLWVLPIAAQAQFTYTTNSPDTNTITITGFTGPGGVINIPSIIAGKTVTTIGVNAFSHNPSITSVVIPDSVISIGPNAFSTCTNLASVALPTGITRIENYLFYSCTSLTNVTIPAAVTNIGGWSFQNCQSLKNLTIPYGITTIPRSLFEECHSLLSVTIPATVTSIETGAFYRCYSLTNVTIPAGITNIGSHSFMNCRSLNNITIPYGITTIPRSLFEECTNLSSVTIPATVTSIETGAFYRCYSLTNVTIPAGVTNIGGYAFNQCGNLGGVYFDGDAPSYGETAFSSTPSTIYYIFGSAGWPTVPEPWAGRPTALWTGRKIELYIGHGLAYPIATELNYIYQLQGRDTPFTNEWYCMGDPISGTDNNEYGFERGEGPIFLPARRWRYSTNTDGCSLQFDGVNDFAFQPHDALFNLTSSMTLEAWVKPNTVGLGRLISKASSPSIVCYSLDLNVSNNPNFRIFNSSGSVFLSVTGSTALATGQWRHVSASWDGSQGRIFLDGALDGIASGTGSTRISSITHFLLGSILGSESFNGRLDQVRVWSVARSEGEVSADYQSTLTGGEAGLVGLWKYSPNEGQSALDSTANGLDLMLGSDPIADASDPVWASDSYPPQSIYSEIFNFGDPCLVVGHKSTTGGVYQLQSTAMFNESDWGDKGALRTGMHDWMDYLVFPTNKSAFFRAYGPDGGAGE